MSPMLHVVPVDNGRGGRLEIPVCELSWRSRKRVQARIVGPLRDDWPLRLARGLAAARVNLLDGLARRIGPASWIAVFEIEVGASPLPDLLELATGSCPLPPGPEPALLEVEVCPGPSELEIEVHAWDSVGLLAAVLGRVDRAGLVVGEILLATEAGCAFHRLRIETPDQGVPSARQRRVLSRQLALLQKGG